MSDVALILAAGASRRLGQPKQLVELDGETLVARSVRVAREAGLQPIVVTGCERESVERASDAATVHNDEWPAGIGSSISCGVRHARDAASTITVMTCDQYMLEAEQLTRLHEALDRYEVAAAVYGGVLGVPAVFTSDCFDALEGLSGDVGARKLLRGGRFRVVAVPMAQGALDLDQPRDLEEVE